MRWAFSQEPEVIDRRDDSPTKHVVPQTIDHDPGGQGIRWGRHLFRQFQAPTLCRLEGDTVKQGQTSPGNPWTGAQVMSAFEKRLVERSVSFSRPSADYPSARSQAGATACS